MDPITNSVSIVQSIDEANKCRVGTRREGDIEDLNTNNEGGGERLAVFHVGGRKAKLTSLFILLS